MTPCRLRAAVAADAPALARVHRSSRADGMPWLPVLHDEEETVAWFAHGVLPGQRVVVAEEDGEVVALSAVAGATLEQLYVLPHAQGRGLGRALLDRVKGEHPDGLGLSVFTRNLRARRLYEAAGFLLVAQDDGSGTEEHEPSCTYAWAGPRTSTG